MKSLILICFLALAVPSAQAESEWVEETALTTLDLAGFNVFLNPASGGVSATCKEGKVIKMCQKKCNKPMEPTCVKKGGDCPPKPGCPGHGPHH